MTTEPTTQTRGGATERRVSTIVPGQVIAGRYEVRRLLGRGGMGEVWLAFDLKLRVDVALKDLLLCGNAEVIRREVRAAREVVSPNVCRIFDLVEADGRELLSMEYVDGRTLREVLKDKSPLELAEAQPIASQFLAGLEAIHVANLVHRDLKPENVMITRTGRVVIMDFGLARETSADSKSISGTPAYMAPEQVAGEAVDARTDVFAAGLVLAEMVTPTSRDNVWIGIRKSPPDVGDTPWSSALRKAVSHDRRERFRSAQELLRALEEVRLQSAAEEKQPYPGLSAFTRDQSEFFFGREGEVDAILRKLERFHLLGLIGPSGAGKSSFLQAGLLPMLPKSWGVIVCQPGSSPFFSLGRALTGETEIDALRNWRTQHSEALLIIDQFEELFTLNGPEVQARFAELIGRAVAEADVRVVLSLRDDFLTRCADYDSLAPILSDLTSLRAPAGSALRRALVQPALLGGYRFEDDSLVHQMLDEVGDGRGTLPLLAFAASRLWEKRNRQSKRLMRASYDEIGGVSGALAQHAEETLEQIGPAHVSIVREIFRNLVTAQGTRAAREREDLLSVFPPPEHEVAEAVLATLVAQRLLTAFEIVAEGKTHRHVEIIHESLLSAWPRLARWQTQDADSALLRDQLRQGAQLWNQQGRPDDLLWTGSPFHEYQLWRERYSGALTTIEQNFADAMTHRSRQIRYRRRAAIALAFAIVFIVATVTTALWRSATSAADRAEAQRILALGQVELDRYPTAALAYFTASIERADTSEARSLVMGALWRGPVVRTLPLLNDNWIALDFSPDTESLAVIAQFKEDFLVHSTGDQRKLHNPPSSGPPTVRYTADGRFVVTAAPGEGRQIRVLSASTGQLIRTIETPGIGTFKLNSRGIMTISETSANSQEFVIQQWPLEEGEPTELARFADPKIGNQFVQRIVGTISVHPDGLWVLRVDNRIVKRKWLNGSRHQIETLWRPQESSEHLIIDPKGEQIASAGKRTIEVWSAATKAVRVLDVPEGEPEPFMPPRFAPDGSKLIWAMTGSRPQTLVWDLSGPAAEPISLRSPAGTGDAAIDASSQYAATAVAIPGSINVWPLGQARQFVFRSSAVNADFTPDSASLISCPLNGPMTLFSMQGGARKEIAPMKSCFAMALDPSGTNILANGYDEPVYLIPVSGGPARKVFDHLPGMEPRTYAFDRTGRIAAAYFHDLRNGKAHVLRIFDLENGTTKAFPVAGAPKNPASPYPIGMLAFASDNSLYSDGWGGVKRWDLQAGTNSVIYGREDDAVGCAMSGNGRHLLCAVRPARPTTAGNLVLLDLRRGAHQVIRSHGSRFTKVGIDYSGDVIATSDDKFVVRVGRATGDAPHLLVGLNSSIAGAGIHISRDGKWIAARGRTEIRVWPMPDLSKPPIHTLPRHELLAKLKSLTNVRVVPDGKAESGCKVELAPFRGWKDRPTW